MENIKTRIPTNKETSTMSVQRSRFGYRYAYARASEYKNVGDTGQDYLVIIENEKRLCFALCDGVSQSFFGDLAARSVGEALVDWLFYAPSQLKSNELETDLTRYLQLLTEPVTKQVKEFILPTNLAPMVQNALDKKRAIGSESTFIAGRIDVDAREIILTWMGDSILRIWGSSKEITPLLGDTFLKQERWSSLKGLVGNVHTFTGSIEQVSHFVVYSDGLKKLNSKMQIGVPSNQAIDIQIEEAGEDDISLFEFWDGRLPTLEIIPQVIPTTPDISQEFGQIKISWQPAATASQYEIEFRTERGELIYRQSTLPDIHLTPNELPASIKSLRLRNWYGEEPGAWSGTKLLLNVLEKTETSIAEPDSPVLQTFVPTIHHTPTPNPKRSLRLPVPNQVTPASFTNQQISISPSQIPPTQGNKPELTQPSQNRKRQLWVIGFSGLAALILLFCGILIGIRITKTNLTPTPIILTAEKNDIFFFHKKKTVTVPSSSPLITPTPTVRNNPPAGLPGEIATISPEIKP